MITGDGDVYTDSGHLSGYPDFLRRLIRGLRYRTLQGKNVKGIENILGKENGKRDTSNKHPAI